MFIPIWLLLLVSFLYFIAGWIGAWSRQEHRIRELRLMIMSGAIQAFQKTMLDEKKLVKDIAITDLGENIQKQTSH